MQFTVIWVFLGLAQWGRVSFGFMDLSSLAHCERRQGSFVAVHSELVD
jgi:hypothetical protein